MSVSLQELKKRAIEAIDANKDKILEIGDSIFSEPELGYKEFKTAKKVKDVFDSLGYEYEDEVGRTGIIARRKGRNSKVSLAIMGELDAVVSPEHPHADPETGAAHACGHNAMIASIIGVAYALHDTGIMEELDGDIVLMAVPAEEYVEIGFRDGLIEEGEISFIGGKQEFIKLGKMDDIDMMIMQHTSSRTDDIQAVIKQNNNGFIGKLIEYKGKEAHAGGAPHLGINALNAAVLGLNAVNAQRETFMDQDAIRVHPIITKGGDLVNVVPADVKIETYVRGKTIESILDANEKVSRAFKAGGDAVGAETIIKDIPGYLPLALNDHIGDIMYENASEIVGKERVLLNAPAGTGSTDAGDISYIMPTIHAYISGAAGAGHTKNYVMEDKENAYVNAAKIMVTTAIDLLGEDAKEAEAVLKDYKPMMTKEEYLKEWGKQ